MIIVITLIVRSNKCKSNRGNCRAICCRKKRKKVHFSIESPRTLIYNVNPLKENRSTFNPKNGVNEIKKNGHDSSYVRRFWEQQQHSMSMPFNYFSHDIDGNRLIYT
ncbi:hypothetical protein SNEBB_008378 [Seison nebaliae]|nr:hypothetical protein SNEBB_008378 [Seison nebaliae]